MKLPATVYAIRNEANGKVYVGRSTDLKKRLHEHMALLRRGAHPVADMQADYNKYGRRFSFYILDTIETYEERGKELEWQKRLNTLDRRRGYNYRDPAVIHYGRRKSKHT